MFQLHHLLPQCTLLENVLLPTLRRAGRAGESRRARAPPRSGGPPRRLTTGRRRSRAGSGSVRPWPAPWCNSRAPAVRRTDRQPRPRSADAVASLLVDLHRRAAVDPHRRHPQPRARRAPGPRCPRLDAGLAGREDRTRRLLRSLCTTGAPRPRGRRRGHRRGGSGRRAARRPVGPFQPPDLLVERIGATAYVVSADRYFREDLSRRRHPPGPPTPVRSSRSGASSSARPPADGPTASTSTAWTSGSGGFTASPGHGPSTIGPRSSARRSPPTSGSKSGDGLLLRIESEREVPGESLYGRRESAGRTIRLTCRSVASRLELGEFALRPGQGTVLSVFVPLKRLQRDLLQPSRVNAVLVAAGSEDDELPRLRQALRERADLSDVGLRLRPVAPGQRRGRERARPARRLGGPCGVRRGRRHRRASFRCAGVPGERHPRPRPRDSRTA